MPEKPVSRREKLARRRGEPLTVKASDVGRAPPSPHAAKKEGHVVARAATSARGVSARRPPGEEKARRRGGTPLEAMTRSAKRRRRR
ncbi:MAG TPA: hypothetical protein VFL83_02495 [Anaeromyxobacter sp.]|nr:hypothetical protein [Anaeromyxobacter sp.]